MLHVWDPHLSLIFIQVFSASFQPRESQPLKDGNEVVYRIHTPVQVVPGQSVCLLWNHTTARCSTTPSGSQYFATKNRRRALKMPFALVAMTGWLGS